MAYRFIDNVSIADVAFEAEGRTLEELFESAGNALMNTQVKDLGTIAPEKGVSFSLENKELDRLLHDFLQELIFYKDAELLLFRSYRLRIEQGKDGVYRLTASLKGEQIDQKKHELLVDVKAVSWHMFRLGKTDGGWMAFVILDV